MSTEDAIRPIITGTYGDGSMPRALAAHLAEKIEKWPDSPQPRYGAESREDMIRLTCWDWFSGGTTAESVARKIEEALMTDTSYSYRVVRVDEDGNETATVEISREYAEKMWARANDYPWIARCWIERRPKGEWEVCSSETGSEFMALRPGGSA